MDKVFKWLFGESAGTVTSGLFAVGSWYVSQFFVIPFGAEIFRAGAILGILGGYALGNVSWSGKTPRTRGPIAWTIAAALGLGLVAMVDYYFFVGGGHVNGFWPTLRAVAELLLVFACAGYLMPIAGIEFAKP